MERVPAEVQPLADEDRRAPYTPRETAASVLPIENASTPCSASSAAKASNGELRPAPLTSRVAPAASRDAGCIRRELDAVRS
jgi:hypothetical protein